MRRPASAFIAFLCLLTLGTSIVGAPPNRVTPPPSALVTIADHLSIQPGQQVDVPVDATGWQHFTLFYEGELPAPNGTPDDSSRCVVFYQVNGLGENLAQIPLGFSGGNGMCVSNDVPHQGLQSGALFGPKLVVSIAGTANLETPATVTVLLYLH